MKIFVTGAGGFVGRALLSKLVERGHSATALLLRGESAGGLEPAAQVVRGDITDPSTLRGALEGHDAVVHLAAEAQIEESMRDPGRFFLVNVHGGLNLLDAIVVMDWVFLD